MFCVISFENSTIWSPINFIDMFIMKLSSQNNNNNSNEGEDGGDEREEKWISINIANGDNLPNDIMSYKGIVLTGSRFNICDREQYPWFENICEFIRQVERNGKPKLYGGCFGCQLIGHALGGEVSPNPTNRFILKAENITPIQPLFSEFFHQELNNINENNNDNKILNIIVSHGYCVSKLPSNSTLIATSSSCVNEIFVSGRYSNILACQSHPEFEYEYAIRDRIWPRVVNDFKRLNDEEIEISSKSFQNFTQHDSILLCQLISSFLHSD